jgi:hypothetical protein
MSPIIRMIVWSAAAVVLGAGALSTAAAVNVSNDELLHMIQTAKTRADHEAIASVYEQQARADRAAANEHKRMEKLYKAFSEADPTWSSSGQTPEHCQNLASIYQEAAQEHDALAELHRQVASGAR